MSSIFISYSHKDKQFAKRLATDVRDAGHAVWIDEIEILVGNSLIEEIRNGIDSVDFVAAIISLAYLNSQWIKKELDLASNREIDEKRVVVLPILLDDVELPGFLKGKYYADFKKKITIKKVLMNCWSDLDQEPRLQTYLLRICSGLICV